MENSTHDMLGPMNGRLPKTRGIIMPSPSRTPLLIPTFAILVVAPVAMANTAEDLAQAEDWFSFGDYDKALNRASSLVNGGLAQGDQLRDAHVLRARCLLALDRKDESEEAYRQAVAVDPNWKPDPVQFTESEIAVFSAAVAAAPATAATAGPSTTQAATTPPESAGPSARINGFFIGLAASALMVNGSGELAGLDVNISDPLPNELELNNVAVDMVGWGWGNNNLFGFKPLVGYRISPQFSIYGSYQYWLNKTSESNNYTSPTGQFENVDGDWSQSSIQIMGQFYPSPAGKFYVLAGYEAASVTATYKSTWDWQGGDAGSESEEIDFSGGGLIVGVGMDFTDNPNGLNFYGAATYSLVTVTEKETELIEFNVGGPGLEIGFRTYFTK